MTLDELCERTVAVWGLGTEGLAMARLLHDRRVEAWYFDDRPEEASDRLTAELGGASQVLSPAEADWSSVEVVVRAPGVSRYRPELAGGSCRRGHGDYRHGPVVRGLRRCAGGGRHRHQGEEHHGRR